MEQAARDRKDFFLDSPPPDFSLVEAERAWFERSGRNVNFPFRATGHVLSIMKENDPDDPIRRQFLPRGEELVSADYESADPLAEERFTVAPDLVRRYPDRAILKVTRLCAAHCRFCFRKSLYSGGADAISRSRLLEAAACLARERAIREVLLTGGDPLMLSAGRLREVCDTLRAARPDIRLRVGTRLPIVLPGRVTPELAALLASFHPLWMTVHVNHPAELGAEAARAIDLISAAGIRLGGQSVLLAGVNDDADTLAALFRRQSEFGMRPYYLFHLDPAPSTAHFRVPLARGIALVREVRHRHPELALPVYALDLPGGGGKVMVESLSLENTDGSCVELTDRAGRKYRYPR